MAISKSLFTRGLNQRVGGAVFYQQAGRTLVRELAAEVSNPRTISQMTQRVKWSNLVAFYKANKGWMKKAYESKKATQSDYNRFMSLNSASARIAFTKQQAQVGACVVDAYRITEGSLPPVEVYDQNTFWETNLYLPEAFDGVSVKELTEALLAENPSLRLGDQISFIRVTQLVSNSLGVPYIKVTAHEMRLDLENINRWDSYLPADVVSAGNNQLIVTKNSNSGAFAFIVSRTQSGKTYVSTQTLTLVNMESYITSYSSQLAFDKARDSYGITTDIFLDSNQANAVYEEVPTASIMGVTISDTGDFIKAGEELRITEESKNSTYDIEFTAPVEDIFAVSVMTVAPDNQVYQVDATGVADGNIFIMELPSASREVGTYITSIQVKSSKAWYDIKFYSPKGGDLE